MQVRLRSDQYLGRQGAQGWDWFTHITLQLDVHFEGICHQVFRLLNCLARDDAPGNVGAYVP